MKQIRLSIHYGGGEVFSAELGDGEYAFGSGESDAIQMAGDGVLERHGVLEIAGERLAVAPVAGRVSVNGSWIERRVEVEFPASVELAEVTLILERTPSAAPLTGELDVTLPSPYRDRASGPPPRSSSKSAAQLAETLPMSKRPTTRPPGVPLSRPMMGEGSDKAPLTGEYTLVREIARGGMGKIYFGEDPQLKRQVAIKVSSLSAGGEDPRFSREAEVLAKLAHPNIVPIHALGVDGQGRPYYSMKLVKGRTLQSILDGLRKSDPELVRDYPLSRLLLIFQKVCDAMAFAHSQRILHRDLKPENIMVGEYGEALVMDWGLAKTLGAPEEHSGMSRDGSRGGSSEMGMTMEGDVMGTPQYMSPEQAEGKVADLDERSDIYSLGGILYAILTLRAPIEGKTLDEVLTKVKSGRISSMITRRGSREKVVVESPEGMDSRVPEALQAVTMKAMALNRDQRYVSVEAFSADIERYQNGFATQAERAGAMRQLALFIKRHKGVSAAVALFLVAAVGFMVRLELEKDRAVREMERSRRAAAAANMSLAEAAAAASDSGALQQALAAVPEDLRTPDWSYFQERIDTSTFTWTAPKGLSWVGLEDWPSKPEHMLALRSDGELFAVNVTSGTLQALWKFNPSEAKSMGPIGVSSDGSLVALGFDTKNDSHVEIRRLADRSTVRRLSRTTRLSRVNGKGRILVSGSLCVVEGSNKVQVWEQSSGKLLWDAPGELVDFSGDEKSVFVAHQGGGSGGPKAEKRDALSGSLLLEGWAGGTQIHGNAPNNSTASLDWRQFFSPMFGSQRVRALDPWTGKVAFEVAPRYGNLASVLMPPGDFFAVLGRVSGEIGVVEIRDASVGRLSRSLAFPGSLLNEGVKLRAKSAVVALHTPRMLKVWRLPLSQPKWDLPCRYWGMRRENSSRVLTHDGPQFRETLELWEASEKDPKKRILWKMNEGGHLICGSPDGARLIVEGSGKYAAYRFDAALSRLTEIWAPRAIRAIRNRVLELSAWAIHPGEDRVWTGLSVFEFSTGRILVEVKNREGLNHVGSPVWVGPNRVVEIAMGSTTAADSEESSGELLQIALWDADSGTLIAKTRAPNAGWLCPSPDGLHIAEAGADKRVRIRNARTLEVEQEIRVHEDSVTGLAWHPSLPRLVTASKDGVIRVWDVANWKRVEEFTTTPPLRQPIWIEIPPNGSELVEHQEHRIRVYLPESFRGAK